VDGTVETLSKVLICRRQQAGFRISGYPWRKWNDVPV
jgi:hypothetical protein